MKTNRFLGFIMSVAALAFAATACDDKKEDLGAPSVEVEKSEISFEKTGGTETVQVTATRDWKATTEQDWISIGPREGKGSSKAVTVEIKVMENSGLDREGSVKFDIGFDSKTLTVKQKGTGSVADMTVYKNDFDKAEATKTYGTGTSWPYLDQFDGWKNATGTGAGSEEYSFKAMSARANSTSNSNYSDYAGSGSNNLFFGSNAYFSVTGIKLQSATDYSLTFGAEKYSQDNGSLFKHNEFHVYVSNDGAKWVELEYSFPNGDKEGRWDLATSNFTVPSGTTTLGIYVKVDVASSYRLDDLCLAVASSAGTVIDFSKGVDLGTGGGGGGTTTPTEGTVASIVSGKTDASVTLKDVLVTGVTNKSAVVTDATGSILVFVNATPGVKVGDKVTVTGTTGKHNGLMQITKPKFQIASSGNTVTYPDPKTIDESNVSSYKSDVVEFVTFKGKVKKNDVYYNIFIGGVTDKDLSLSYFPGDMESLVDKEITVKGYFVGGGTHYQIVAVNVDGKDITEAVENGGGNPGGGDNPGGETPDEGKFASNVKWTLGENAYDGTSPDKTKQTATINGVKVVTILKLGTSNKPGKATLTIPANTSKLSFYAVAWKGKTATLVASSAGTEVGTQAVAGNVGATGNPEYTISVSDSDHYTMSLSPQASESNIEITTKENVRVILFGIVAE